jgi:hypothetical protein
MVRLVGSDLMPRLDRKSGGATFSTVNLARIDSVSLRLLKCASAGFLPGAALCCPMSPHRSEWLRQTGAVTFGAVRRSCKRDVRTFLVRSATRVGTSHG